MVHKESILFVTGNAHKLDEANQVLSAFGLRLEMARLDKVEIQANGLDEIASHAASLAAVASGRPVVCEDSGLFVDALGGFPGPFSSYVFKTIGCGGVLKLLRAIADRKGRFESAVSYCEPRGDPLVFTGRSEGTIAEEARGAGGFGFDPIFIPAEGDGRTFAEMELAEKGRYSHRGDAFRRFGQWRSGMTKFK